MFLLRQPGDDRLDAIADAERDREYTQPAVGLTRESGFQPPAGFDLDRYGLELGQGGEVFERARAAIEDFAMYPPGWTRVHHPRGDKALRENLIFVAVVRHFGFYSALPCRVVYVVDHDDQQQVQQFGFALGTLPGHAECGEERFWVSWDRRSDAVRYDVVAYSRPRNWLARLGYPIVRGMQKRFARDSLSNMRRTAQSPPSAQNATITPRLRSN